MRFIRMLGASGATTLLWAAAMSAGLGGCGGPPEVAKSPDPVKVEWGKSGPATAPDAPSTPVETTPETPAAASTEGGGGPAEIDLDALPAEVASKSAESAPREEEEEEEEPTSDTSPAAGPRSPLEKEMRAAVRAKEKKPGKPKKKAIAKKSVPAAPEAPSYAGPNACKAARFSVARVGDACATGGRSAAKAVMKDAIGKALAVGTTLRCSDCHAEQRDYTLKPDAVAQLKKWLDG
jgi:hypothetical protein